MTVRIFLGIIQPYESYRHWSCTVRFLVLGFGSKGITGSLGNPTPGRAKIRVRCQTSRESGFANGPPPLQAIGIWVVRCFIEAIFGHSQVPGPGTGDTVLMNLVSVTVPLSKVLTLLTQVG